MPWLGLKRIAFIPVDQPGLNELPVPPDWRQEIERRLYFTRDSDRGIDVSLRDYIYTTSYGRAVLEGVVLDTVVMGQPGLPLDYVKFKFEHLKQEFDAAAVVTLGKVATGQGECFPGAFWAWFNMVSGVGLWAMELTHVLGSLWDLYTNDKPNDLDRFDNMDNSSGTHSTAYTKMLLGWLDASAIAIDTLVDAQYDLHAVGLVQPPPSGRSTAVKIETNTNPLFVEARLRVDQYDGRNMWNRGNPTVDPTDTGGIKSEGVIVYELAGEQDPRPNEPAPGVMDPLIRLKTLKALQPGAVDHYVGGNCERRGRVSRGIQGTDRQSQCTIRSRARCSRDESGSCRSRASESGPRGEVHGTQHLTLMGVQPIAASGSLGGARQHGDDGLAHRPDPLTFQ